MSRKVRVAIIGVGNCALCVSHIRECMVMCWEAAGG